MTINVLLAEDHELTRRGLAYGLKTFENINILAQVENGKKAVEYVSRYRPDIVLMDIAMPILNGINATKEIKSSFPNIKVIILTSISEKKNVLAAFNSGANGYCMKNIKINDLVNIIKTVMEGAIWVDPIIAEYILELMQSSPIKEVSQHDFNLTNREKEILKLITNGLNNKDISEQLFLSVHTVKNHLKNIFQKLSVDDRTQAAIIALKENLVK